MQLEGDLEIMRTHRTNIRRQSTTENTASPLPRPVHVYLLRYTDKQYILHIAASALKDNPFLGGKSLHLWRRVEEKERRLKEAEGEVYQGNSPPWNVPARSLYKVNDSPTLRSFFLPDDWTCIFLCFFFFDFLLVVFLLCRSIFSSIFRGFILQIPMSLLFV